LARYSANVALVVKQANVDEARTFKHSGLIGTLERERSQLIGNSASTRVAVSAAPLLQHLAAHDCIDRDRHAIYGAPDASRSGGREGSFWIISTVRQAIASSCDG
jgi:hypothetical protein